MKRQYNKLTPDLMEQLNDMLDRGYSNRKIAKKLLVARQHVNYYRNKRREEQEPVQPVQTPVEPLALPERDGPRILVADIETLPMQAYVWSMWNKPMMLEKIKGDWSALSYSAKWLGEEDSIVYWDNLMFSKEHTLDNLEGFDPYQDKGTIESLCQMLDRADFVVGHNFARFDLRKVRARALKHGLPPFRMPTVIDTLNMARDIGAFTSNRLEYLAKELTDSYKSKHKNYPGFSLWRGILMGEAGAWREMRDYNPQDVRANEEVYLKLRGWAPRVPSLAPFYNDGKKHCPRCGSTDMKIEERARMTDVSEYVVYKCGGCGGFSRGRYTQNSIDKRKSLLKVF